MSASACRKFSCVTCARKNLSPVHGIPVKTEEYGDSVAYAALPLRGIDTKGVPPSCATKDRYVGFAANRLSKTANSSANVFVVYRSRKYAKRLTWPLG